MSLRLVLAATAALAFAVPAFAQEAPAAAPAAAEAPVKSPAEIEMEAKAQAFEARMAQLQPELEAAITASGGDQTKGMADVDAVLARYQPDIEGFATQLEAFIDSEIAATTDDAKRQQMTEARGQVGPALRGIPAQIRAGAAQAIAAQAAAPAAPQ
ncbi:MULTISPECIES: translation initiation factor IF-2 [unclassified Brevundimonas]|uniref:translation initiation factor IF-2 n=1 Tax=unclassified Brevundimonas TaxID=2622653 RepID=UPI000CFC6648|nr:MULTISPECIES: translation initiation factor IF-2 [unclassified Brevundimonas]PRA36535.1 translation initiation factor IF-2 [Brevundimonas sp. MYb27]PQZ78617.1 translation initiation factor IF-2 [Brevundimonas sp. MYb31]PRB13605.1 translation initiation factor IF-2 [Brevundimonas sp. MYb52]PRB34179.1 translation initiation factor IF-2 [Brevundimonas sp. MYb46]PRB46573.1 translation initiation factor IF-2 [Brevundimonas sp. MYb33]